MAVPHGIDRSGAAGGTGAPELLNALGELADPGKDALIYWDDSIGDFVWVGFTGGDTPTDGKIIVGDGTNWVTESGATARASLGSTSVGDAVFIAANAAAGRTALDVPSNSEAILDTIVDAKGDLIVGSAADTVARKAVGADGLPLIAKSDASDGLAYEASVPYGIATAIGLVCTRASASTISVTADAMWLSNSSGGVKRFTAVSETASIAASGANGIDTGAEAGNTWYYLYVIGKLDGTVDSLLSLSATAPTLPSGYVFSALVSAIRNDGSSNFRDQIQHGRWIQPREAWLVLNGGSATSHTAVDISAFVPPSHLRVRFRLLSVTPASAGEYTNTFYSSNASGREQGTALGYSGGSAQSGYGFAEFRPETAQTPYYAMSAGTAAGSAWILGFEI